MSTGCIENLKKKKKATSTKQSCSIQDQLQKNHYLYFYIQTDNWKWNKNTFMIASKNYEILKFNKMCVQVGYLKLQNITEKN